MQLKSGKYEVEKCLRCARYDTPLLARLRCARVGQQDRDRCLQCHCCIINSRSKTGHRNQDLEPGRNTRTMTISEMLIGSKDRGGPPLDHDGSFARLHMAVSLSSFPLRSMARDVTIRPLTRA